MKTTFQLLWPWFAWSRNSYFLRNREHGNFYGCGLPTTIVFDTYKSEWSFELQILGFGFAIERYPCQKKN